MPAFRDIDLHGWLAGRRYGVPASVVEHATRLRLAGDWRGACAVAGIEVAVDLAEARRSSGARAADRLAADLAQLAPDLIRWHLPRGHDGLLGADVHEIRLAAYRGLILCIELPRGSRGPQRLRLRLRRGRHHEAKLPYLVESWVRAPYLWHARAASGLLRRVGGGDRTPFFHRDGRPRTPNGDEVPADTVALTERVLGLQDAGEITRAWTLAGVRVVDGFAPHDGPGDRRRGDEDRDDVQLPAGLAAMVPAVVRVTRAGLTRWEPWMRFELRSRRNRGQTIIVLSRRGDDLRAWRETKHHAPQLRSLAPALWQRVPDLELLRTGQLRTEELHPLVRAALFPEQADPGYHPTGHLMPDGSTVAQWLAGEFTVHCSRARHRLGFRDGRLVPFYHPEADVERERAMHTLGGSTPECFEVLRTWRGETPGHLPPGLDDFRTHTRTLIAHGDTGGILRLLDAGIEPPAVRGPEGGGLLHHLAFLFDAVDADGSIVDSTAVLSRLLTAGMDINERDPDGRTPLLCALLQEAPPRLVSALLAAGADPRLVMGPDADLRTQDDSRSSRVPPECRRLVEDAARAVGHLDQDAIDERHNYRRRFWEH